jgi:hypothetical protein
MKVKQTLKTVSRLTCPKCGEVTERHIPETC